MFNNINPTTTKAWQKLNEHFKETSGRTLKELFAADPNRFDKYSLSIATGISLPIIPKTSLMRLP